MHIRNGMANDYNDDDDDNDDNDEGDVIYVYHYPDTVLHILLLNFHFRSMIH